MHLLPFCGLRLSATSRFHTRFILVGSELRVISRTPSGIRQHIMRCIDDAHHLRGVRIGIPVRVQLLRQLAISLLDLLRRGIASNTQQLVMRGCSLHCTCCPWPTAIFDTPVSAMKHRTPMRMPRKPKNRNQRTRKCPNPQDSGISLNVDEAFVSVQTHIHAIQTAILSPTLRKALRARRDTNLRQHTLQ